MKLSHAIFGSIAALLLASTALADDGSAYPPDPATESAAPAASDGASVPGDATMPDSSAGDSSMAAPDNSSGTSSDDQPDDKSGDQSGDTTNSGDDAGSNM